ncbi:MAG TPA: hypothetical protein VFA60_06820 [Terriglobales bacterium]|nr:hypothetical protein [Terriglobales bacterium]
MQRTIDLEKDEIILLRSFIEAHLSQAAQDWLDISYVPRRRLPAAVKLATMGQRFRLERDDDGTWCLATDEENPKLLDRSEREEQFQEWLLEALARQEP